MDKHEKRRLVNVGTFLEKTLQANNILLDLIRNRHITDEDRIALSNASIVLTRLEEEVYKEIGI